MPAGAAVTQLEARVTAGRAASSLRTLALRGTGWAVVGYAFGQVLRLGSNLVLAWLLVPEAFGLMFLVNVFMQGLQMCSDVGIGPSIIQHARGANTAFLDTAWTIQIIRGWVLWLCACILAWPTAWLFSQNDPSAWQLLHLLPVVGLTAVFSGFFSTRLYTLNRELSMGRLTMIQLTSQIAGIVVMIVWASVHRSVWALAAGGIAVSVCKLWLSHSAIPGKSNRLAWDSNAAREMFHFGKWIAASTAVAFLAMQADRLLLGNLVSMQMLGVYGFGMMVATLPRELVAHLTTSVLFPALSKHGRDTSDDLGEKVYLSRRVILPAAAVAVLAVVLLAPPFFQLLYPEVFHDAGTIAQLLSVAMWLAVLVATTDRCLLAMGNARALAVGNIVNVVVTVPAAIAGYFIGGLAGFILGYACGTLANLLVIQMFMYQASIPTLTQDARYSAVVSGFVVLGLAGSHFLRFDGQLGHVLHIAVSVAVLGAAAVWATMHMLTALQRT